MGEWMWGAVVMSVAVIIAGGIAWWLARGCVVTIIGARLPADEAAHPHEEGT